MFQRWIILPALLAALIAACAVWVDQPVALLAAKAHLYNGVLANPSLSAPLLVGLAVAGVLAAGVVLARRDLPDWANIMAEAALLSGLALGASFTVSKYIPRDGIFLLLLFLRPSQRSVVASKFLALPHISF